jgi:ABC-2 type transport system ATP-binding protein
MTPVLKTHSLTKTYRSPIAQRKVKAVDDLSFEVYEGEIFGFLGPNGAGKTTTTKILAGLLTPTSGEAYIFGKPLEETSVKQRIGFLPEQPYFYPYLTGAELLDFSAQLFGIRRRERNKRTDQLLAAVGLENAARMRISSYSKGMLQRIGLAQALVNDPELLILDEPLGGLDPVGRKDIRDLILEMKEKGKTVFFSSHILPDVEMICDRVGILISGRLISVGRLDELLAEKVESVEITAESLSESDLDDLRERASRVLVSGEKVMIVVESFEDGHEIQRKILNRGGRVLSVVPRRKTLEEHFMEELGTYREEGG